jgi:hypothetical protein
MNNLRSIITAVGLGAGVMYLFDPERGTHRRAELHDQVDDLLRGVGYAVHAARRLGDRASGLILETRQMATGRRDWREIVPQRSSLTNRTWTPTPRSLAIMGGGLVLLSSMGHGRMATAGRWTGLGLLARGITKRHHTHQGQPYRVPPGETPDTFAGDYDL